MGCKRRAAGLLALAREQDKRSTRSTFRSMQYDGAVANVDEAREEAGEDKRSLSCRLVARITARRDEKQVTMVAAK